jgi:TetR/AcrR family transcriptional regulator, cholesterol catabolism regulator
MTTGESTTSRYGLMRHEIMKAALKLLEKNSVSSVTLSQVAQELNLSKAAIYHYFDTKEDLIRSIFAGWATSCREELEAILALPLGPEEMLRQILRTHLRQITSEFSLYVLSVRVEAELPEPVRLEVRHLKRDTDLFIRDVIARGQREGVFQPVDVRLAELAGIGMFNWVWRWYRPGRDDPEAIAELFTRIFIEGIRVRTNNGSSTDMPGSKTLPALAAEYHASEIRYHTEMLQRLVDATQTEPVQEKV